MEPRSHRLPDIRLLVIRRATVADAGALLAYVEAISGESEFLSFGPGEFGLSLAQEEEYLERVAGKDNALYLVGLVDGAIVSALTFSAGDRPRARHCGEFGLSVRKEYWGRGVGSRMLDALLEWARGGRVVTKINLRVRTDNARAIRLYETRGFLREGTLSRETLVRGEYFDHHLMGLRL